MEGTITKLTPELLEEIKEVQKKLVELRIKGIYAINQYSPQALIWPEIFDANFSEYAVDGKFKIATTSDGFKFFALYPEEVR